MLYERTDERGVKDMLAWLLARDTMHQNQWEVAIAELEKEEKIVIPNTFPRELEKRAVSHVLFNTSARNQIAKGRLAHGPSMDGEGELKYVEKPVPYAGKPKLKPAPPYMFNTPPADYKKE